MSNTRSFTITQTGESRSYTVTQDGESRSFELTQDDSPRNFEINTGVGPAGPTYTLPTASATVKGGVKIGAGLTMTGEILSANGTDVSGLMVKAANLSDVDDVSAARDNLGLGSAAVEDASAFDTAGAAETAETSANAYTDSKTSEAAYDLGWVAGSVTIDYANGRRQRMVVNGDTVLEYFAGGAVGNVLTIIIDWAEGSHDLTFGSGLIDRLPTILYDAMPITLDAWRCYSLSFTFMGGGWCLTDMEGPLTESID